MAIGNVSFGNYKIVSEVPKPEIKDNLQKTKVEEKSTEILKDTAVAASVGAVVSGTGNLIGQYVVLKNPTKWKDLAEKGIESCKTLEKAITSGNGVHPSYAREISKCQKLLDFIKNGKYDFKSIGKTAGIGALVVGGTYLAYRGLKALFTSKS